MKLKSAFSYYAVFGATPKIDFTLGVRAGGKTDSERLLRLQWHEKLDCAYNGQLTIPAPHGQSC